MSILNQLSLTACPENTKDNPILRRRQKLLLKMDEQLAMAQSHIEGKPHTCFKEKWQVNPETKIREKVRVPKNIKPFYYKRDNKYFLEIRYFNKALELQKDMYAIDVGEPEALVATIKTVIEAIVAGELDDLLVPIAPINKKKSTKK
ncbi:MAG: hypothetical protein JKY81_09620 [Colwellia sp.]|nr:hypothetical protein [Colwellia sp.]